MPKSNKKYSPHHAIEAHQINLEQCEFYANTDYMLSGFEARCIILGQPQVHLIDHLLL
jgi:hypothetical protein